MRLSPIGRTRFLARIAIFLVNIVVLSLSARVNIFQEYFFVADLFPLALSIITLVLLTFSTILDFFIQNPFTARAPFEIASLAGLSVFWLSFNAFSTSRWRHVPMKCNSIPSNFADEISWCKDLQALKSFVWIEWSLFSLTTAYTLRYVIVQNNLGNKHVWTMPLSRYTASLRGDRAHYASDDDFLNLEKP